MNKKSTCMAAILIAAMLMASLPFVQAQEPVTLVVWDQFDDQPDSEAMDMLIDAFEEAHPNITVDRQAYDFQDLHVVLRTALASGTGPDVFYYGGGAGFLGPLVDAGLVMPLEDVYEAQGWDHIFEWTKRDGHL